MEASVFMPWVMFTIYIAILGIYLVPALGVFMFMRAKYWREYPESNHLLNIGSYCIVAIGSLILVGLSAHHLHSSYGFGWSLVTFFVAWGIANIAAIKIDVDAREIFYYYCSP